LPAAAVPDEAVSNMSSPLQVGINVIQLGYQCWFAQSFFVNRIITHFLKLSMSHQYMDTSQALTVRIGYTCADQTTITGNYTVRTAHLMKSLPYPTEKHFVAIPLLVVTSNGRATSAG